MRQDKYKDKNENENTKTKTKDIDKNAETKTKIKNLDTRGFQEEQSNVSCKNLTLYYWVTKLHLAPNSTHPFRHEIDVYMWYLFDLTDLLHYLILLDESASLSKR